MRLYVLLVNEVVDEQLVLLRNVHIINVHLFSVVFNFAHRLFGQLGVVLEQAVLCLVQSILQGHIQLVVDLIHFLLLDFVAHSLDADGYVLASVVFLDFLDDLLEHQVRNLLQSSLFSSLVLVVQQDLPKK